MIDIHRDIVKCRWSIKNST